ncbi:MAG: flagellar biosynthesis protein FlgD [Proteobacteria bacterium]|nr:flagellar biosynthesis protein FlgD [Pseudomonadota bacterium]
MNVTDSIIAATNPSVVSALNPAAASGAAAASKTLTKNTIAGNFTTFLQLLTTQLKNQNPLEPLDTNQFTQQLVQFAQVEQQLKSNDQLNTLVSLEKSSQATAALGFVGNTVAVDGATAQLANNKAQWSFSVPKPASADVRVTNAIGQLVYSGAYTMQPGQQNFVWDGRGNNGTQWPTARDASGASVAVATEVEGTVDSVDLTKSPPLLTVAGQQFTLDKIKRVTRR